MKARVISRCYGSWLFGNEYPIEKIEQREDGSRLYLVDISPRYWYARTYPKKVVPFNEGEVEIAS